MSQSKYLDRVKTLIQRRLAEIIQQDIHDSRLGLITLSGVSVSKDLSYAKIYFTVLSGESKIAVQVLNAAAHHLRKVLAKTVDIRMTPQLHFVYDDSVEYGRKLSKLIQSVEVKKVDDASGQEL